MWTRIDVDLELDNFKKELVTCRVMGLRIVIVWRWGGRGWRCVACGDHTVDGDVEGGGGGVWHVEIIQLMELIKTWFYVYMVLFLSIKRKKPLYSRNNFFYIYILYSC